MLNIKPLWLRRFLVIKAIVFDKDGTLLDLGQTWDEPSLRAIDKLLANSSLSEEEKESFKAELGMIDGKILPNTILSSATLSDLAQALAEKIGRDGEELEDELEGFLINYMEETNLVPRLIEGVRSMLDDLKGHYILAIVTNDNHNIAYATLEKSEILSYFDFIACADDYGAKPNSTALHELAREFDIGLHEMIYVGDSVVDVEFGKLTQASIAYADSPQQEKALEAADYLFTDFNQLLPLIKQIETKSGLRKED